MRKVSSQLALIGLTILCALAVGYGIAALTGSRAPRVDRDIRFVEVPEETVTAEPEPATTSTPEVAATGETSPAASVPASVEASPAASVPASAEASTRPSASAPAESAAAESAAAESAAAAEVFIDETFNTQSPSFPPREEATWSAAYVDGQYRLSLNGQTNISLVGELPAVNYRLAVDVMVDDGGAGVVFLGTPPPAISYRFLIAPDGTYSIERQEETTVAKVVDWTPSDALEAGPGARNRLRLERRGSQIQFFANDEPLTTFDVPEGNFTNRYGFVLSARDGTGQASFDNLRGERLP